MSLDTVRRNSMTPRKTTLAYAAAVLAVAITLGEGVALGALGLLALALWWNRDGSEAWSSTALYPALGVAIWLLAGIAAWGFGGYGIMDFGELGRWISFGALVVVPLTVHKLDPEWLDRIATAYLVALLAAVVFSLVTVSADTRPGEWLVRGGSNGIHQGRMPFDSTRTVAGGFYFHRLKFAHVASLGLMVLMTRQLTVPMGWLRRTGEVLAILATSVAFFLTYVRADVLGVAAGMVVLAVFTGRRSRWALGATGLIALILIAAVPSLNARVGSIFAAQASGERALIWSQAIRIIADHPLGIGLGNYSKVVSAYYDTVDPTFPTRTYGHNLWLTNWAEGGPLGVFGLLGGYIALAFRARTKLPDAYALCLLAATACFLTIGLTHDVFYDPPVALSYACVIGYCAGRSFGPELLASRRESEPDPEEHADEGPRENVGGVVSA